MDMIGIIEPVKFDRLDQPEGAPCAYDQNDGHQQLNTCPKLKEFCNKYSLSKDILPLFASNFVDYDLLFDLSSDELEQVLKNELNLSFLQTKRVQRAITTETKNINKNDTDLNNTKMKLESTIEIQKHEINKLKHEIKNLKYNLHQESDKNKQLQNKLNVSQQQINDQKRIVNDTRAQHEIRIKKAENQLKQANQIIRNSSIEEKESEIEEDNSDNIPKFECICGTELMLLPLLTIYNGGDMGCDVCKQTIPKCKSVYHCPKGRISEHQEGFDICVDCGENIVRTKLRTNNINIYNEPILIDSNIIHEIDDYIRNGTVTYFDSNKGFGFIAAEDNKDYFFHCKQLHCFKSVIPGSNVQFNIAKSHNGKLEAIKVTGPNGTFVQQFDDSNNNKES